jgi:site-specific DNA recombinase
VSATTINGNRRRGTGILNNELYIGMLVWNRLNYGKDPETDNRVSRPNPEEAIVRTEVPDLRIVDDRLWHRVRERQSFLDKQAEASGGAARAKQRPRSIFSGLMRCGVCGAGFSKISASHFGCSGARNKGETVCTNRATIRCDILETTVLDGLRSRLMDPTVYKAFADAFVAEWNRQVAQDASASEGHRLELARVATQLERLVDAIADGGVAMATVRERLAKLEARKTELRASLAAPAASPPRLHPNLAKVYRQEIASLTEALEGEDALDAREAVRSLIESITIHAVEPTSDGKRRVELRGALAAMLALGRGGSAVPGLLAVQMEMVAGTGFEPVTFRL